MTSTDTSRLPVHARICDTEASVRVTIAAASVVEATLAAARQPMQHAAAPPQAAFDALVGPEAADVEQQRRPESDGERDGR